MPTKYNLTDAEKDKLERSYLRDRERAVFKRFYRRGHSIEDIAAELDISRRTVDRELASLRKRL